MRAVVQRVAEAAVRVDGEIVGAVGEGLVVLLGVAAGDVENDVAYIVDKLQNLRVFPDLDGRLNRSVLEIGGEVLVISQFTLLGDARRGRRPSWSAAAPPAEANALYEQVCAGLAAAGLRVQTGVFRAMMDLSLVNRGPVTVLLDSRKAF